MSKLSHVQPRELSEPLKHAAAPAATGHSEKACESEADADARGYTDKGRAEGHCVHHGAKTVLPGNAGYDIGIMVLDQQSASMRGITPEHVEKDRDDDKATAVNGCRCPGLAVANIFRYKSCRERDDCDPHQQQAIQHEESLVGALDVLEETVMIDPHDQDRQETRHISKISWPLP